MVTYYKYNLNFWPSFYKLPPRTTYISSCTPLWKIEQADHLECRRSFLISYPSHTGRIPLLGSPPQFLQLFLIPFHWISFLSCRIWLTGVFSFVCTFFFNGAQICQVGNIWQHWTQMPVVWHLSRAAWQLPALGWACSFMPRLSPDARESAPVLQLNHGPFKLPSWLL